MLKLLIRFSSMGFAVPKSDIASIQQQAESISPVIKTNITHLEPEFYTNNNELEYKSVYDSILNQVRRLNPDLAHRINFESKKIIDKDARWIDKSYALSQTIFLSSPILEKIPGGDKVIASARRGVQALNLLRKGLTSMHANDTFRLIGAIAGIPALFAKNVGDINLDRAAEVMVTNAGEDASEVTPKVNGKYKNLATAPVNLFKFYAKAIHSFLENPSLIKDKHWRREHRLTSLLDKFSGMATSLSLAYGNRVLARAFRFSQYILSDISKTDSKIKERSSSALAFLGEFIADSVNSFVFKGKNNILNSLVGAFGFAGTYLLLAAQGKSPDPTTVRVYENPLEYMKYAVPQVLKAMNPMGLLNIVNNNLASNPDKLFNDPVAFRATSNYLDSLEGLNSNLQKANYLAKVPEIDFANDYQI